MKKSIKKKNPRLTPDKRPMPIPCAKTFKSKKDYVRNPKHKKKWDSQI